METDPVARFFAYARERHSVYLRRLGGQPWPWTQDVILRECRFTNVFRELDRTTLWFNKHVRGPLRDKPEVLPATVVFRWFNRVTTGEALFCQTFLTDEGDLHTAFEKYLIDGFLGHLRYAIKSRCGAGPYVTGAYTINTISAGLGRTKLEGVLDLIRQWFERHPDWREKAELMMGGGKVPQPFPSTLENFSYWCRSPCLGEFMTYEVACDLRHTLLLARAPDVDTWANLGPGARRGLNRINRGLAGREANRAIGAEQALQEMRMLLALSRDAEYWPQRRRPAGIKSDVLVMDQEVYVNLLSPATHQWPAWELREVEHTLCEFDKYERVRLGEGRPRGSAPTC